MDFYQFIESNRNQDPNALRLSAKRHDHAFDTDFAITQIEARKKFGTKFPEFLKCKKFLIPDLISGEQASHQAIATYHSRISTNSTKILDMTAGLGIDSLTFATRSQVTAVELNPMKAEILKKNAEILGRGSLIVLNLDSIEYLKSTDQNFDLIFVDPSRRDTANKRVYNLRDCSPDVIGHQNLLISKASTVLIKASPLLDVSQTLKDFHNIKTIRAVGVKGECKELLIELDKQSDSSESVSFEAVNLDTEGNIISLFSTNSKDKERLCRFASLNDVSSPCYILEPSAMVMKFAPWNIISDKFKAKKFDKSSHLFLAQSLPKDFPGRVTKFKSVIKKQDRKSLEGFPASVVSKNHPMTSDEIRKSFRLKEGDDNFIYASRIEGKPILLLSESIAH